MKKIVLTNPFKKDSGMASKLIVGIAGIVAAAGIGAGILFVLHALDAAFTIPEKAFEQVGPAQDFLPAELVERIRTAHDARIAGHDALPSDLRDPFAALPQPAAPAPTTDQPTPETPTPVRE
jgi:hypothetical protein